MKKGNYSETEGLMNTLIGKETSFDGILDVKGSLRIDGTVKGKVICSDTVTIGATGLVEAEVQASTAIIAGRMVGNVTASEKIELQAKCEMEGDLKSGSLVIEQGAIFCGACNMKNAQKDLGFLPPQDTEEPELLETTEKADF